MHTVLAGDIGGTKTLLALYGSTENGQLTLLCSERYVSSEWADLAPMVQTFLSGASTLAPVPPAQQVPAAACFAVAGPVENDQARLTNLPWQLSGRRLASDTGISCVELVNDFAVLVYGLPHLLPEHQAVIHPGRSLPDNPLLVIGAGTGLGVAFGQPVGSGCQAMASEAAHGEFAPRSQAEWDLKRWLTADLNVDRLSIERVVSGTGLGHVARWLLQRDHPDGTHPLARISGDLPAAVAAAADQGDPLAVEALQLWLGAYGSVCGDLALTGLCRGGIWLAGGTAGKLLKHLGQPAFRRAFLAKGRLSRVLESIPITAVVDPSIGQFSAACRARMLVASSTEGRRTN